MPRYTKPTTPQVLLSGIDRIIQKNPDVTSDVENLLICREECAGTQLLEKDLSKFNFENVLQKEDVEPTHPIYALMGANIVGQVTCLGVLIGTDYGFPFYAILYLDDKTRLRGYIPKAGNAINPMTKLPFGDGDTYDDQIAQHLGYARFNDIDESLPTVQAQFYDMDKIKADITKRIQFRP